MTIALERYAEFLQTIPDAALLVDAGGRIAFANEQAEQMFGYPHNGLHRQPLECLIAPARHDRHRAAVREFFAAPRPRAMGSGQALAGQRADGTAVPVDIMLQPLVIDGAPMALAIVRDISERQRMEQELRAALERESALAQTDPLTGAANRRSFVAAAQREFDRLSRHGETLSLCYIDLDRFKSINDRCGHDIGDALLSTVARSIAACLRSTDLLARLGGDEFALLLPATAEAGALATMSKVRAAVAAAMAPEGWPITLSAGVLTCREPPASVDAMLRAADALMYRAKQSGRDAVVAGGYGAAPA